MASGSPTKRKLIPYFEGVNNLVSHNLAKSQEFSHMENARTSVIGTIEKREGYRRLGDNLTRTANYGLFQFDNTTATSTGFYNVATVAGTTSIYYLNTSAIWTALSGGGTSLVGANFFTTSAEGCLFMVNGRNLNRYIKPDGTTIVTSATTTGSLYSSPISRKINYYKDRLYVGDYANVMGDSTTQFDITNTAGTTYRYTYDTTGTDPVINNGATSTIKIGDTVIINAQNFTAGNNGSFTVTNVASNYFDIANASGVAENNKTIGTGFIYADTTRFKNGIMMSSVPLGIVSLVSGDHAVGVTTVNVTDTKYIQATDTLSVYRGSTFIENLTISAKTEDTITVTVTANALNSSDELWINGTFNGAKIFRWASKPSGGVNVKQYDTFRIAGGDNDAITMMINVGNIMMIANKTNMAVWNGSNLENYDMGVGCVSERAYIRHMGVLFFMDYTGIYATTGTSPKLISSKVEKYITGATRAGLEAATVGKKGYSIFFAIGTVILYRPDGSTERTLTNVVLEYNVRQENWYILTGIDAHQFATYKGSLDTDRLEFCADSGEVYELFYGTKDNNSTEVPFRIDTQNLTLATNFENICYPKKIIIETERGSGIKCFISLDEKDFYEIQGDALKGMTVLNVTSRSSDEEARCRRMKISIRENSDRLCVISRIAILYVETVEEETYRE